jgi:penicillin-binding protein 1C
MQLGGLLLPQLRPPRGRSRSYLQKFEQIRVARALERGWSKEQILEAYLNLVPFRGEVEGLPGAARLLLGKEVGALSADEGVVLAATLRSPNAPPQTIAERGCRLKQALISDGASSFAAITCERIAELAALVGSGGIPDARLQRVNVAPHVGRLLAERSPERREILTTLDSSLQRFAIEQLKAQLATLRTSNVADGAVLVVHNPTGRVLAYVGNSGAASSARFIDGVQAKRQAGSTLKPFLYGLAIERRFLTADTLLNDAPLELSVGSGVYRPKNYDGIYRGPVSVRVALASSLNIPAVLTAERVGVAPFVELLGKLRFGSLQPADLYGPSVALGSPVVSLWELVNAYRTLAQGGKFSGLTFEEGEESAGSTQIFSPEAAFIVSDILADRGSRSPTFGLENSLSTPYWSAAKTGTSKDMTDNWCIGFSREYTVGIWVGNFSGEPMHNVSGVTGAAPLWVRILDYLAARRGFSAAAPETPPGIQTAAREGGSEFYITGTEPHGGYNPVIAVERPLAIVSPPQGAILAIDPDIPAEVQKIPFQVEGAIPSGEWVLNGVHLADLPESILWAPQAGRHTLSVRDASGRELSAVSFSVRGMGELPANGAR